MAGPRTDIEPRIPSAGQTQPAAHETGPSSSDGQAVRTPPVGSNRPTTSVAARPALSWRRGAVAAVLVLALLGVGYWLAPLVQTALNTISTDDAYVNGHVTFVAPRVAGQVARVLVDDNYRVSKGDLLVELDKEP